MLLEAYGLTARHRQVRRLMRPVRDDRSDVPLDALEAESEPAGKDAHRLRKADVPGDGSSVYPGRELLRGVTDADPTQNSATEATQVDDTLHPERLRVRRHARRGRHERVERKTRVEPGAEDGDCAVPREVIQLGGECGIYRGGERRLLRVVMTLAPAFTASRISGATSARWWQSPPRRRRPSSAVDRSRRLHGPRTSTRSRAARMRATLPFTCPAP